MPIAIDTRLGTYIWSFPDDRLIVSKSLFVKLILPLVTVVRRRPDRVFKSGDYSRQANDLKQLFFKARHVENVKNIGF